MQEERQAEERKVQAERRRPRVRGAGEAEKPQGCANRSNTKAEAAGKQASK